MLPQVSCVTAQISINEELMQIPVMRHCSEKAETFVCLFFQKKKKKKRNNYIPTKCRFQMVMIQLMNWTRKLLQMCVFPRERLPITGDLGHLRAAATHRTALRQRVERGKRWRGTKLENKEQDSGVFSSKLLLRSQKQVQVRNQGNQKSSRGFSCFSSVSHQPQSSHNSFAATRQFSLID